MENIIKGIRQYYPVSDKSLEELFSHMEKLELPKNVCYIWTCTISTGSIYRLKSVTNNSYTNSPMSSIAPNWDI